MKFLFVPEITEKHEQLTLRFQASTYADRAHQLQQQQQQLQQQQQQRQLQLQQQQQQQLQLPLQQQQLQEQQQQQQQQRHLQHSIPQPSVAEHSSNNNSNNIPQKASTASTPVPFVGGNNSVDTATVPVDEEALTATEDTEVQGTIRFGEFVYSVKDDRTLYSNILE